MNRTIEIGRSRLGHTIAATLVGLLIHARVVSADDEGASHEHDAGGIHGVEINPAVLDRSGVQILSAGPRAIRTSVTLTGVVVPQVDRVARISPRFSGILRETRKRLGDRVAANEVVAVVESNQSLQRYEVRSAIAGSIVQWSATVGEAVSDAATIYEVADYTELFADLFVFPPDYSNVRAGQAVRVRFPGREWGVTTSLSYLSPATDPATQSRFVRAVLTNPDGHFQPGMFVVGDIVLQESSVPVAVAVSAIRTVENVTTVFVQNGTTLEPREVRVGRRDSEYAEVTGGLSIGEKYAAGNTFLLLAELEKGEADHDH